MLREAFDEAARPVKALLTVHSERDETNVAWRARVRFGLTLVLRDPADGKAHGADRPVAAPSGQALQRSSLKRRRQKYLYA